MTKLDRCSLWSSQQKKIFITDLELKWLAWVPLYL